MPPWIEPNLAVARCVLHIGLGWLSLGPPLSALFSNLSSRFGSLHGAPISRQVPESLAEGLTQVLRPSWGLLPVGGVVSPCALPADSVQTLGGAWSMRRHMKLTCGSCRSTPHEGRTAVPRGGVDLMDEGPQRFECADLVHRSSAMRRTYVTCISRITVKPRQINNLQT
jgi:hypothetical protein